MSIEIHPIWTATVASSRVAGLTPGGAPVAMLEEGEVKDDEPSEKAGSRGSPLDKFWPEGVSQDPKTKAFWDTIRVAAVRELGYPDEGEVNRAVEGIYGTAHNAMAEAPGAIWTQLKLYITPPPSE